MGRSRKCPPALCDNPDESHPEEIKLRLAVPAPSDAKTSPVSNRVADHPSKPGEAVTVTQLSTPASPVVDLMSALRTSI